jgi:transposase
VGSCAASASTGVTSAMEVPTPGRERELTVEPKYQYLVGIDWATEKHDVCVLDLQGHVVARRVVEHRGDALRSWFDELLKLAEGQPERLAIGIETPRGALVESLVERGFHVYSLNPKQLDRFRDRHNVAGAKDDKLDAFVVGDSLRTDRKCYRRVRVDDPLIIQVRELSRASDDLTVELGRLSNQLREQVHRLLPQLLTLCSAADEPWLWDLLTLISDGAEPTRIRATQVDRILKVHRIRRLATGEVLAVLREPPPWTTPGTQLAVRAHIGLLLPRLRTALEQSRDCERQIEMLLDELAGPEPAEGEIREHRDVRVLQSLPGAGKVVVATMLAEASQPLAERDYQTLRAHSGLAPVTKASGKRSKNCAIVTMRHACNDRLRNAFFHWARVAITIDDRSRDLYQRHRQKGQTLGRALRSVGDHLLRVLMAMLKSRTLFDASRAIAPAGTA